jgi:catechol 2,3-dioxygenase-like lactoylglutathione lyase family enzyme
VIVVCASHCCFRALAFAGQVGKQSGHRVVALVIDAGRGHIMGKVLQMRLVVEADDYDAAVAFYRDALGLEEEAAFEGEGDARVMILDAGRATLEIINPAQKRMIDDVEVGRPVAPKFRLAFEVADAAGVTETLTDAGAELVAEPTETPWRSLNARLEAPDLQITVFQELDADH